MLCVGQWIAGDEGDDWPGTSELVEFRDLRRELSIQGPGLEVHLPHVGIRRSTSQFASRRSAEQAARTRMERRLKLGYVPRDWTLRRLRGERPPELELGTYKFRKGSRRWDLRISGLGVEETLDDEPLPIVFTRSGEAAKRKGFLLIKARVAAGFKPTPETDEQLPELETSKSKTRRPVPLPSL